MTSKYFVSIDGRFMVTSTMCSVNMNLKHVLYKIKQNIPFSNIFYFTNDFSINTKTNKRTTENLSQKNIVF